MPYMNVKQNITLVRAERAQALKLIKSALRRCERLENMDMQNDGLTDAQNDAVSELCDQLDAACHAIQS
jgi:hypothetical protein